LRSECRSTDTLGGAEKSFDAAAAAADLDAVIAAADIVVFSFHDCPWCIQAKQALAGYNHDGRDSIRIVEIDVRRASLPRRRAGPLGVRMDDLVI
jgi:hypothetical protein